MSGLLGTTTADWAARVRSGDLDPLEGVRFALDRAERLDARLNALLGLQAESAEAEARALAERMASGTAPGPLAGVPFIVKDNIAVEHWPLTCGSRILEGFVSAYTATAVQRLRAAGAIPIGRANLDEFAMGASTENSAFGVSRNPYDTDRVPGGSSGGSAVAVAAGYCPFSLGSETGGSVRQPASFCGLFGLKPTYGRISRYGLVAFASSLDHIGIFGRTAADLALAFDAAAGLDTRDSTSLPESLEPTADALARGVAGKRVALLTASFDEGVDTEIQAEVRRAAAALEAAGATVTEAVLPHAEGIVPTYYLINTAEASANLARYDGVRYGRRADDAGDLKSMYRLSRDEGFGDEVKRRILLGTFSLSAGYQDEYFVAAQRARTLIRQSYAGLLADYDLILSPTTPTPAFRLGEKAADPVAMYLCDVFTAGANLAGLPAVHVPTAMTPAGLPIGVQLTAGVRNEAELIAAAGALESACGGAAPIPELTKTIA